MLEKCGYLINVVSEDTADKTKLKLYKNSSSDSLQQKKTTTSYSQVSPEIFFGEDKTQELTLLRYVWKNVVIYYGCNN